MERDEGTYNVPVAVRLTGALDRDALEQALADVAQRHESLRTVFPEEGGEPYPVVLDCVPGIEVVEVAPPDLAGAMAERVRHRFDLTADAPVRVTLFPLGQEQHVLLLVIQHIAADGWSLRPLLRDLGLAYTARCDGNAPDWRPQPVRYADYTLWQRELLGGAEDPDSRMSRQLGYWQKQLAALPVELRLPVDRPRSAVAAQSGGTVAVDWEPELHSRLLELARSAGCTLFMVLQAGFAALLTRMGAGTDIPFGTPVAGRSDSALDDLVGFFVNTLVLRTDTAGDPGSPNCCDGSGTPTWRRSPTRTSPSSGSSRSCGPSGRCPATPVLSHDPGAARRDHHPGLCRTGGRTGPGELGRREVRPQS
ncbi:condensation domain-containing protein [Streptomyces sp. M10(2022)]